MELKISAGNTGSQQNPPGAVTKEVLDVFLQGIIIFVDRFDPFPCKPEAAKEENNTEDGNHHDSESPAGLNVSVHIIGEEAN